MDLAGADGISETFAMGAYSLKPIPKRGIDSGVFGVLQTGQKGVVLLGHGHVATDGGYVGHMAMVATMATVATATWPLASWPCGYVAMWPVGKALFL